MAWFGGEGTSAASKLAGMPIDVIKQEVAIVGKAATVVADKILNKTSLDPVVIDSIKSYIDPGIPVSSISDIREYVSNISLTSGVDCGASLKGIGLSLGGGGENLKYDPRISVQDAFVVYMAKSPSAKLLSPMNRL